VGTRTKTVPDSELRPLCRTGFIVAALLLAARAVAGETGSAARDLNLLEEPRPEARVVGKLAKDGRFELVRRERFWSLVSASGPNTQQGWVQSFYLTWGEAASGNGGTASRGLAEIVTFGAKRNGNVTATLGVRGLDEEQLKSAQFNAEELKRLEGYGAAPATATRFAGEIPLQAQKLDYLPAPAAGAGPAEGAGR
jgi:hypothetical protein